MTRAQLLLIWPLPVSESHILSRTVSKLSCSIDQIFAFEYGVGYLYFNALLLRNFCEYHRKSCIAKSRFWGYIFVAESVDLTSTALM